MVHHLLQPRPLLRLHFENPPHQIFTIFARVQVLRHHLLHVPGGGHPEEGRRLGQALACQALVNDHSVRPHVRLVPVVRLEQVHLGRRVVRRAAVRLDLAAGAAAEAEVDDFHAEALRDGGRLDQDVLGLDVEVGEFFRVHVLQAPQDLLAYLLGGLLPQAAVVQGDEGAQVGALEVPDDQVGLGEELRAGKVDELGDVGVPVQLPEHLRLVLDHGRLLSPVARLHGHLEALVLGVAEVDASVICAVLARLAPEHHVPPLVYLQVGLGLLWFLFAFLFGNWEAASEHFKCCFRSFYVIVCC